MNGIPYAVYAARRTDHDLGGDRNDGASSPATTRTTLVVDENFPPEGYQKYQSDVVVDLLHHYEFEYVAINPGASFRGLHDSIVIAQHPHGQPHEPDVESDSRSEVDAAQQSQR